MGAKASNPRVLPRDETIASQCSSLTGLKRGGSGLHAYTDAAHIADGVIGLKQRSLQAASDPTA